MAQALSNKEVLSYIKEVTFGTVPATPAFQFVRYVSGSFKAETSSTKSAEIATAREVADIIRTSVKATGSFNFELSYSNLDDMLAALLGGTWTTNVLTVGSTRQSLTIERGFTDIGQFELYKGAVPTSLSLNVGIGKVIDGSINFTSLAPVISSSTASSTQVAAPTNSVMNPIDSVQLAQEGGAGAIAGIVGFTINISSPEVLFAQLANINPVDIEQGQLVASGTIDLYWQDATYLTKYLGWTTTSLAFTLGGTASQKYAFLFSKVKLSAAENPNPGMNQPMISKLQWQAFRDPTNTTLKITRTP